LRLNPGGQETLFADIGNYSIIMMCNYARTAEPKKIRTDRDGAKYGKQ
jgi:hypothetical protein